MYDHYGKPIGNLGYPVAPQYPGMPQQYPKMPQGPYPPCPLAKAEPSQGGMLKNYKYCTYKLLKTFTTSFNKFIMSSSLY